MKMKKMFTFFLTALTALGLASLSSCSGPKKGLAIVHFDQTILGDKQKDLSVSIGIKKGNIELKEGIDSVLSSITTEQRNKMMIDAVERSTNPVESKEGEEVLTTAPHDPSKKDLIVGLECNYAPFNWTETKPNSYTYPIHGKTGEFAEGYDIQIAKMIAETLDYNLIIKKMEFDALISSIQTDTINAVIAGMTDTEERRQSISFTAPYYTSELVLIVRSDDPLASATSLEAFNGKRIVSQKGTVTNDVIADFETSFGVQHMDPLDRFSTCALSVSQNTADAMTAELPVAESIVNGSEVEMTSPQKIGYLIDKYGSTFGWGLLSTLILAIFGTSVGLFLGILLALVRNLKDKEDDGVLVKTFKKVGRGLASIYINVFRGTPMMVQAMIIFFGTEVIFHWSHMSGVAIFNGAFYCGLFVITVNTAAYMAEIVRSGMNAIDEGQMEAGRSLGMSYSRTLSSVVMPQALRNSIPTILNELIVNIKDSSVLNVIGLTELYASVSIATGKNYFTVEGYIIIAVIYLTLTLIASSIVRVIERKLDGEDVFKTFRIKHYIPKIYKEDK